jgi:hypothetical protein
MSSAPIPILITGKAEVVGKGIIAGLSPEYEVVHFTLASAIENELPLLLQNKVPEPASSSLGTGNWSAPPRALLIGGAYTDDDVASLRKLIDETEGNVRRIPWLRVDSSKPAPPLGPEYGKAVVERAREALKRLEGEGKLTEDDGEVYFF